VIDCTGEEVPFRAAARSAELPLAGNATRDGRARNRRVSFEIMEPEACPR
jgi:outer membrane protein OmpA-like peptidoglycan-associated protein